MQGPVEDRKTQIPEQLDCLGHEIGELESITDKLKERLQPVMKLCESLEASVPRS